MYNYLKKHLPPDRGQTGVNNEPNVHFEHLFHVMEMYLSYERSWGNNCKNPQIYPVFGPFIAPTQHYDINELRQIMTRFVMIIVDIVKGYDDYFRNDGGQENWYRDFFNQAPWKWDVFNFNYDTTLEDTFGEDNYEDGFDQIPREDYCQFHPQKLFDNVNVLSTINHLHGCIRYYYERKPNRAIYEYDHEDLFKYKDCDTVLEMMNGRSQSQGANQTHEELYAGSIITGLRKTDKLNCIPYDYYHAHLFKSLLKSPKILIAGYSFGDLYVNQQLDRMVLIHGCERRIVLIDYWNQTDIYKYGIKYYLEYKIPNSMANFLMKMCEVSYSPDLAKDFKFKDTSTLMVSKNRCVMLLVCGMREAAKYSKEIYNFLGN